MESMPSMQRAKINGAVQTSASHVERESYPKATLPLVLAR
jgi:hypothetical protein